jgi:hypothetical protein
MVVIRKIGGEYDNMKNWIHAPIIGIAIGEILIFDNKIILGIGIHVISLIAMILAITFGNFSLKEKNVLQSLTILPLLRMISLSIPQLSGIYVQYLVVYGIMAIPVYLIMKNQYLLNKESEINVSVLLYSFPSFKRIYRIYIYVPTIVLTIFMIGMIGQYIGVIPNVLTISQEVANTIGELVSIFLIIILSISLLVSDTKYWNEYISRSINIYSSPLLLTDVLSDMKGSVVRSIFTIAAILPIT